MKVTTARFFQAASLSFVAVIFVGYWNGLGEYLTIDYSHYWRNGTFMFSWKVNSSEGFNNVAGELNLSTVKSSTNMPQTVNAKTTPGKVDSSTLNVITPGLQVLLNTSTTTERPNNVTLFLTSSHINHGRLGNQMFKYASLLGIAHAQGRQMFIYPGTELEKSFKLHNVDNPKNVQNFVTIKESNPVSFDPSLMKLPLKNVTVYGFMESFIYFSNIIDVIKEEFTFKDAISSAATAILNRVRANNSSSLIVGVHARRGDFLGVQKYGYGVPEKTYFFKAFDWMKAYFPGRNVTFIVVSDDLAWCKANLVRNDTIVMPTDSPAVHMALLSICEHVVISGGTYGWWAGWLAGGKVVYYKGYLAPGTHFGNMFTPKLYYPSRWIGLDN